MTALPSVALSVRQPWAWAIIHAGKDVENRSRRSITLGGMRLGRIAVHAAKGMTRAEYEGARDFMASLGVACPPAGALDRGGIVGAVDVVAVVATSASPWFFGPWALALAGAAPCTFVPAIGALGYFAWKPAAAACAPAARWMAAAAAPAQGDLF